MSTIALITDFGSQDTYVGVMKGIIARIAPDAHVIDLTHSISPQNVREGAFALLSSYAYFPPGTIFVAVVDPGVGSARRALAVQVGDYTFVAPDNGLLSYLLRDQQARQIIELTSLQHRLPRVSYTFHGRDIFAPAAAHLANGEPIVNLGRPLNSLVLLPEPLLAVEDTHVRGEIMHIDRYGNLVTSIGLMEWAADGALSLAPRFGAVSGALFFDAGDTCCRVAGEAVDGIAPHYAAGTVGSLMALVGSSGFLEIAVNQGSAAERLGARLGAKIELQIG